MPLSDHCLPVNCSQCLRSVYISFGLPPRHCHAYIFEELQGQEQFQSLSAERCWLCRISWSWNHDSWWKHQSGTIDFDDRDSLMGTKPLWFSGPGHIHFTNWRKLLHGDIYDALLSDLLPRGIKNVRTWARKMFYNIWSFCFFLDPKILQALIWGCICSTW